MPRIFGYLKCPERPQDKLDLDLTIKNHRRSRMLLLLSLSQALASVAESLPLLAHPRWVGCFHSLEKAEPSGIFSLFTGVNAYAQILHPCRSFQS